MKKQSLVVSLLVAALGATGVTTREYVRAGWSGITVFVGENVPVSFEIARLHEVIKTLEAEIAKAQRTQIETGLKLEKDELNLANAKKALRSDLIQMHDIRNRLPGGSDGCVGIVDMSLTRKLQSMVQAYKAKQAQVEQLTEAIKSLKTAHGELTDQIKGRVQEHAQLVARLNQIQLRKATLELQAGGFGKLTSSDTLNRASQLAGRLEDQIEIDTRLLKPAGSAVAKSPKGDVNPEEVSDEFDRTFGDSKVTSR
jgi:septal ring factor EnvC (AmiA/AmiB activator)